VVAGVGSNLERLWPSLRDTGWLLIGDGANRGARFAITLLLARHLDPEHFGRWTLALTTALMLGLVAELGLPFIVTREVAIDSTRAGRVVGQALLLKIAASWLAAAVALPASVILGGETAVIFLILTVYAIADTFAQLFTAVFRGRLKMHLEAALRGLQGIITFASVTASILLDAPLWVVALVLASSPLPSIVGGIVFSHRLVPIVWDFDRIRIFSLARDAAPILVSSIAFLLYFRIDIFLLKVMRSDEAVGLYNAAYAMVWPLTIVPMLYAQSVYPRFSSASASRRSALYRDALLISAGYGILIVGGIALFGRSVFLQIVGSQYASSASLLIVFAGAFAVYGLAHTSFYLLYSRARYGAVVATTLMGILFNVGANLLFIPAFGVMGAATTTLLTEILVLGVLLGLNRSDLFPSRAVAELRDQASDQGSAARAA
jgi:O-antigen/teichoic acid export membrane protein